MKKLILVLLLAFIASKSLRILSAKEGGINDALKADDIAKNKSESFNFVSKFKSSITDLSDIFKTLSETFHIKRSREIKEIIERDGFSKLHLKSNLFIMNGLIQEKYMDYVVRRGKAMRLKGEVLENFLTTAEFAQWADEQSFWNKVDVVYQDSDVKNSYDSFTVLASQGKKAGTMDILISQFQVFDFKVSDDLIWIKKSDNYMNFFENDGEEFVKRPKVFTEAQIKSLIDFYKLLNFKFIADTFGIEVKLPS